MDNVKYFGKGPQPQMKPLRPGEQIQVDLKNATQKVCQNMIGEHSGIGTIAQHMCGCKYFIPAIALYTVSALVSPTGQELTAQQPVLICMKCKEVLK